MTEQQIKQLIEKHYEINVSYNWWEFSEMCLREDLDTIGFKLDKMYFSGFWSQGDGSMFTGTMEDWEKYFKSDPDFCMKFPNLTAYIRHNDMHFGISHSGHYYHAGCAQFHHNCEVHYDYETLRDHIDMYGSDTDIEQLMKFPLWEKATTELEDAREWLEEAFKTRMDDLYRELEKEYQHLTSDEMVWQTIVANDLDREDEDDVYVQHQDN